MFYAVAATACMVSMTPAQAQSFDWGGTGSTTTTTDYNLGTNWSNPPAGAPPVAAGKSAIFDATGSATVGVTAGPIAPNSWTFNANSQSYSISGANVNFSQAGAGGGIVNNANAFQFISISNNIGESVAGVQLQQLGSSTLILSGTNTYSGGTLISAGTIQVTNNSSVGSGAVTLDGGTFQTNGLSNLTFTNNFSVNTTGGIVDNNGVVLTLSGIISDGNGPGVLQLTDSSGSFGTTVLSGVNTHTGGTNVTGATVQVTNSASVGTGAVTLDNGAFQAGAAGLTFTNDFKINTGGGIIDSNATTLTIAGTISDGNGPGLLQITDSAGGGGVTVLSGVNTYTGGTNVISTTLQVTNNSSVGTGTVTLDNGLFQADGFSDLTFSNNFKINNTPGGSAIDANGVMLTIAGNITDGNGPGKLTVLDNTGGGVVILTGTNTYTGGTTFQAQTTAGSSSITNRNGGGTVFLDQSSAGSATIVNANFGTTTFGVAFGSDSPTAGNATITNNSFGLTEFNASSTAGNATIITNNNGVTNFWDNSTAGNANIVTNNGGQTNFFDNADGGNARFITNGTGIVDFSGSAGPNNDGRIHAGSIEGSGTYFIGALNTLVAGGNNLSTEVSGVIADSCGCFPGPGSLEKVGTGTLTLSGINTYTGTTTVNGGILRVDGSIASSSLTTVNANGALAGVGTVGDTTIAGGGIFAPGNGTPGSSLNVAGNLAFQSGALYLVVLNSSVSSFANVTGSAALNGLVGAAFAPGTNVMKQYTILTAAGGRSGSFAGVDQSGLGGLVATLSYDSTHAFLNFALDFSAKSNLNINQQNVATTLTNFFNANGGIPAAFASLTPGGLTQVSGELATGSQQATFDAMNLFLSLLTDPFVAGRNGGVGGNAGATPFAEEGGANAYAANRLSTARDAFAKFPTKASVARNDLLDQRWSIWGAAFGGGSNTSGNAALGSQSATARAFGFAAGADYRISRDTLVGFALAGGGTNFSVSGFGTGRSDLFQAGAFVRHNMGAAYVTAAAAYGWQDVTTDRTVTVAGVDRLRAEFNANAWSGRVEGGYRFVTPWMGITPYAAGQFTTYSLPAYAEQVLSGAGTFALNYAAKDVTASRTELGLRTDKTFAMQNGMLTLRGRAAWAHDFNTDRNVTALFQTLPGAAFVVNGAAQAHDSALVTAAAEMKWLNGWSAAAIFEGQFSNVTNSYAGKGVARYSW